MTVGGGQAWGLTVVAELGPMSPGTSSLRVTQSGGQSRIQFQEGRGGGGLGSPLGSSEERWAGGKATGSGFVVP